MAEMTVEIPSELRSSPAAHLADDMKVAGVDGARGVRIREIPFLTMVGVRVVPGTPSATAVTELTGVNLPSRCGEVAGSAGDSSVLWLGPEEFLVVTDDEIRHVPGLDTRSDREPGALATLATNHLAQRLTAVLGERELPGQIVDLSANRTTLELSGPSARSVLEKGCHVDLHPRSFGPGQAVSTLLGPVPVVLWQTEDTTYRIMPRASFTDYTVRWLLDAMLEYSQVEVP